jgi:hypothetical protein
MSAPALPTSGHSADVRIQLSINGHVLPVTQLGPDFLVLKNTVAHPPGEGEIAMWIDGHESRWRVLLPSGILPGRQKTRIGCCS